MRNKTNRGLLKLLGLSFGIVITVGGTIGTGILRKPGPIAEQLGNPWLILTVWFAVGIYALLGTLCTIELGTSVPRAGAWYVYAQRAFGNYVGFVVGINSWLGTCASLGFGAYTLSEYAVMLLPQLPASEVTVAVVVLLLLTAMQLTGLLMAGRFQTVISLINALGLITFVAICFIYGKEVRTEEVADVTSRIVESGNWIAPLLFSLQSVFYAFDGWHTAAYFTEEDKNPSRNLPRSMISGVLVIIVIYLLVNAAILYLLPMSALATSKLAAADAITLIYGDRVGQFVTIFLMISILGIINAQLLFNPRVLYSMSRDGLFIQRGTRVNRGGTPSIALPLTTVIAILLMLLGKSACERLSDIATFFFVLGYTSGFASLLVLRKKEPDLHRPWKVPGYPALPIIMLVISVLFLVGAVTQDLQSSWYALLFLILSYPIYRFIKYLNPKIEPNESQQKL
jgi:APA family basic amino acid/polyamine antiporter